MPIDIRITLKGSFNFVVDEALDGEIGERLLARRLSFTSVSTVEENIVKLLAERRGVGKPLQRCLLFHFDVSWLVI